MARHPQKLTANKTFYVNPNHSNASDTAYLFTDKVGTIDYPFATMGGATAYACGNFTGRINVTIVLQADVTIPGLWVYQALNFVNLIITSDATRRKITTSDAIQIGNGSMELHTLDIEGTSNSKALFYCSSGYGFSVLNLRDLNLSGTCAATIHAHNAGVCFTRNLTGNIIGQKYIANNAATIITNGAGANAIPGSTAGLKDESSIYF